MAMLADLFLNDQLFVNGQKMLKKEKKRKKRESVEQFLKKVVEKQVIAVERL